MANKTVSYEDYLKLEGLLALAAEHNKALKAINRAAAQITGEEDDGYEYFGLTSDAVNDGDSARDLLLRLKVDIEEPAESVVS